MSLVALSADRSYEDSPFSNTLLVSTVGSEGFADPLLPIEPKEDVLEDDSDLRTKVIQVTENTIQLDWSSYSEPEGLVYYKVTWSSVAQPAVSVEHI